MLHRWRRHFFHCTALLSIFGVTALLSCGGGGTSSTSTTFNPIALVKAPSTETNDGFGYSIALSTEGTTLAVGAVGESSFATGIDGNQADNSAPDAGAVYLFTRSGAGWVQSPM